jgi:hypothetical protein
MASDLFMIAEFDTVDLDEFKLQSIDKKIITLRTIKNDIIGCRDLKEAYFNKGLIEVLMPLLSKESEEFLM